MEGKELIKLNNNQGGRPACVLGAKMAAFSCSLGAHEAYA